MELIPALDIIEGKCVRLSQGDYTRKIIYDENPLEVALRFEDLGLKRLHLVDLDGAARGCVVNQRVLERIASQTNLRIDFGGGIKTGSDLSSVFDAGAAIATIGTIAVKDRPLFLSWLGKYGPDKILVGADVKDEKIMVTGWTEATVIPVFDFIRDYWAAGVKTLFCTDIAKDGLLEGPSVELYKKIRGQFGSLNLIASGGISGWKDLEALQNIGCSGAIIGKALYEGTIKPEEIRKAIRENVF